MVCSRPKKQVRWRRIYRVDSERWSVSSDGRVAIPI